MASILGKVISGMVSTAAKGLANTAAQKVSSNKGSSGGSSSGGGSSGSSGGRIITGGSGGNAPAGTKIGDTVVTQGGNYKVVAPNTAGAKYNPNSGLWSIKLPAGQVSTGSSGASTGSSYTPLGTYNDANVSQDTQSKLNALKAQFAAAQARGDQQGMDSAHAAAEALRAQYGYSGGADGSQYLPSALPEDTVPKTGLPVYQPQTQPVQSVYDAQKTATLAALQSAYDKSRLDLEQYQAKLPGIYQQQANALAAQAEKDRQSFNEMSAQSGLNAGIGSQAALAMQNQMQNNLGQIRTAEANAMTEANAKLSSLYTSYQNSIAEAIAKNEYERAAALLAEYKQQAQSVVDVAQNQAGLDLDIAGFNRDTNNRNYQRQLELAQEMAKYGDFSGYLALGMSSDQINNLRRTWLAQNPETAIALNLGGYR